MSGIEELSPFQGSRTLTISDPKAMPWAFEFRPVGAHYDAGTQHLPDTYLVKHAVC